jgi:hypothetical protein
MRNLILILALLFVTPARADGCYSPCIEPVPEVPYDGPYFGDRRWAPPPPRAPWLQRRVPRGTPHGAVTPMGEIAFPLAPGHIQAPPHMRQAFPEGIPPAWFQ